MYINFDLLLVNVLIISAILLALSAGIYSFLKEKTLVLLGYTILQIISVNLGSSILLVLRSYNEDLWGILILNLSLIFLVLGYYFASSIKPRILDSYKRLSLEERLYNRNILLIISFSLLIFVWWSLGGLKQPLFYSILSRNLRALAYFRVTSTYYMVTGGIYRLQGLADIIRNSIVPIFLLSLVFQDLLSKKSLSFSVKMLILMEIIALLSSGQRWPIIRFFNSSLIVIYETGYYNLVSKKYKYYLFITICMVWILVGVYTVLLGRSENISVTTVILSIIKRILFEQCDVIPFLIETFPNYQSFRYGTTWIQDLSAIGPSSSVSFSFELNKLRGRTLGTSPPTLFGTFYVNFGFWGMMFGAFFWGILGRFIVTWHGGITNDEFLNKVLKGMIIAIYILSPGGDLMTFLINIIVSIMVIWIIGKIIFILNLCKNL